jgi:hypothetical protein
MRLIAAGGHMRERVAGDATVPVRWGSCMLSFVQELWGFLRARKKFWLLPIIVVMGLLGGLIVLSQGSAVAPFIYTLF